MCLQLVPVAGAQVPLARVLTVTDASTMWRSTTCGLPRLLVAYNLVFGLQPAAGNSVPCTQPAILSLARALRPSFLQSCSWLVHSIHISDAGTTLPRLRLLL